MTVNVLLITHEAVGAALLKAATTALGTLPLPATVVSVDYSADPDVLLNTLNLKIASQDINEQFLILTDLFGSTPCNIATKLQAQDRIKVVSGLNLPMLIRLMNYPSLSLSELAVKAYSGGRDGIVSCGERAA